MKNEQDDLEFVRKTDKTKQYLEEAMELLDLSLYAFNQTVNTDIKDGKGTKTYDIAVAIKTFLSKRI